MSSGEKARRWAGAKHAFAAWWRRNGWRTIAAVAVLVAISLGIVVALQTLSLRRCEIFVEWGSLAEWITGVFTAVLSVTALFAALEWLSATAERRDQEAHQARLIVAEPKDASSLRGDRLKLTLEKEQDVVIRNCSAAHIFNLHVQTRDPRVLVWTRKDIDGVKSRGDSLTAVRKSQPVSRWPILGPGQETGLLTVMGGTGPGPKSQAEEVEFTFTDASGREWKRQGSAQPERLMRDPRTLPETNA